MLCWGKSVRCLNLHGELQHNTSATKATPSRSHHSTPYMQWVRTNWWWVQPHRGTTKPQSWGYLWRRARAAGEPCLAMALNLLGFGIKKGLKYWVVIGTCGWTRKPPASQVLQQQTVTTLLWFFGRQQGTLFTGMPWRYQPTGHFKSSSPHYSCRFRPATGFSGKRRLEMTRSNIWRCHLQCNFVIWINRIFPWI